MTASPDIQVHLSALACQSPSANRGIGRYVRDHTLSLVTEHRDLIAGVHLDPDLPPPPRLAELCGFGLLRHGAPDEVRPPDGSATTCIFHLMSPVEATIAPKRLFPGPFRKDGVKLVATLYDLIPLVYRELYLSDPSVRTTYEARLRIACEADHILALSETTRSDAVRLLGLDPERITVIYGGVSDYFCPPLAGSRNDARERLRARVPAIGGPFIMYQGGIDFRKNMEGLITAYARLPGHIRDSHQLAFVCHMLESERDALAADARREGVENRLVMTGFVPDDLLRELYQACDLFVFPSLYEGLGLPILEAMRCGAAVVVSDRGPMKELMEIDEARFNPEDPSDISRVMARALTEAGLHQRLSEYGPRRAADFSWQRVAQRTADCYRSLARPRLPRHAGRRPKSIAFCSPFPPEQSGVADYSKRLLEAAVARHPLNVDVVVQDDLASYPEPSSPRIQLVSVRQFRWLAERGHYDNVVYCMGNSPFHGYIYELLKAYPGSVWLHDVRLTGFYRSYYSQPGKDIRAAPEELARWVDHYPSPDIDLLNRDPTTQEQQGIYLSGEVASFARRVIVGSEFSKELLAVDSRAAVPTVVLPHAALTSASAALVDAWPHLASKYALPRTATIVASVGIIGPPKLPETIVDAFAIAASSDPGLVLAMVGPCDPAYQRQLLARIPDPAVRGCILLTGYVDEEELDRWLAVARCAVQLRFPSNGESSGAVMRCLAEGVPTIVSDYGPLRELPGDAVVKVPAQVEPSTLARVLTSLLGNERQRRALREGALRYAAEVSLEAIADRFWAEVVCAP